MEPIFEYFDIIVNRLQNPLPKEMKGEKHHIYPKSLGGWNLKCNIVKLTPQEHYQCHKLLPEIFKDLEDENGYKKMLYAWNALHITRDGLEISKEEYAKLRKQHAEICSKAKHTDEEKRKISEWNKGKVVSAETRRKLSEAAKRRGPISEEVRKKRAEKMKGKHWHWSEESKRKLSQSMKGRTPWNKGKKKCQPQ